MDDMFDSVKSSPPAEDQCHRRRRQEGIPISNTLLGLVNEIARGFSLPVLA
jgi:hypothetical protein